MCRRVEKDGKVMYYPHEKELTDQIIADCAKLDELYFNANHMDTFNLDFCTVDYQNHPCITAQNIIESAQETAGRRLSLYLMENFQWDYLPRVYKLFETYGNSFYLLS